MWRENLIYQTYGPAKVFMGKDLFIAFLDLPHDS